MFGQHFGARQGHHPYPELEHQKENQSQLQQGIVQQQQTTQVSHQHQLSPHQPGSHRLPTSPVSSHLAQSSTIASATTFAQPGATSSSSTHNAIPASSQHSLRPAFIAQQTLVSSQTQNEDPFVPAGSRNPPTSTNGQAYATSATSHMVPVQPSSEASQHISSPSIEAHASSLASHSKRNRGRPRKWASEADRRAAEAQRRRDTTFAKKHGLPLPPRASGTFQASPSEDSDGERTSGRPSSTRNPYVYFDKDFGHHTPGTEDAISARDLIVNWLASGDNFKAFTEWSVPERDAACRQLKAEMESHGMSEREVLSIRQQITFIQRGAREARRFELAHEYDELSPNDLRKVAPLVDAHTTPKQAMIKRRWPYYEKLKEHVIAESLLKPIEDQSQPNGQCRNEIGNIGVDSSADGMDHRSLTPSTALISGLADTTLAQALRNVGGQWRGTNDPSEVEIAAVTSRANQLINAVDTGDDRPPGSETMKTIQQSNHRFPVPILQPPASKASSRREAEAWDLEKQQIRQKLELEKEDRRAKDRITERELHLQSIKAFRELLRDGLTRNQAGRVVWQDSWPAMKKSMDEEDE